MKKILIVDYDPKIIAKFTECLEEHGFQVESSQDGNTALETFEKLRPDLVLLAAMLPKMHGFEVCQKIRASELGRTVPVIINTGVYRGRKYRDQALRKYKANEYLERPFSDEKLLEEINKALGNPASQPEENKAEKAASQPEEVKKDRKSDTPAPPDKIPTVAKPSPQTKTPQPKSSQEEKVKSEVKEKPAPKATPKKTVLSVEQRLEDTFSGILPSSARKKTKTKPKSKFSTNIDLDKELSATLSGLKSSAKKKSSAPQKKVKPAEKPVQKKEESAVSTKENIPTAEVKTKPVAPEKKEEVSRRKEKVSPEKDSKPTKKTEADDVTTFEEGENIEFGNYELLKKIATGGMAELFLAKQSGVEGFQKLVAIKKILPHLSEYEDFVEMFIDEAKVAAQLNHQNIAQIYDLGVINKSYYIAMEYVHGKNVRDMIKKQNGPIPLEHALYIGTRICSALDYAHRKKDFDRKDLELVHRDVSPQNFLLSYEGEVKLVDFGIAKAASMASHTHHGALKGKILYMSPEQAYGKDIDRRSDIFSLGSSMFEILTGERLFTGNSEMEILEQVRSAAVRSPSSVNPDIPEEIDRIILKALSTYPDDRYENAALMNDDFESFILKNGIVLKQSRIASFLAELFPDEDTHLPYADVDQEDSDVEKTSPEKPDQEEEVILEVEKEKEEKIEIGAEKKEEEKEEISFGTIDKKRDEPDLSSIAEEKDSEQESIKANPFESVPEEEEKTDSDSGFIMPDSVSPFEETDSPDPIVSVGTAEKSKMPIIIGVAVAIVAIVGALIFFTGSNKKESEPQMTTNIEPENISTTVTASKPDTDGQTSATANSVTKKGDLVELTPDVLKPAVRKKVEPVYPAKAKKLKIEGTVFLKVLINENGAVDKVELIKTTKNGEVLVDAATTAVKQWKFSPAIKNRVPVKVWTTILVPFKL